jgi:hypothetical protein
MLRANIVDLLKVVVGDQGGDGLSVGPGCGKCPGDGGAVLGDGINVRHFDAQLAQDRLYPALVPANRQFLTIHHTVAVLLAPAVRSPIRLLLMTLASQAASALSSPKAQDN